MLYNTYADFHKRSAYYVCCIMDAVGCKIIHFSFFVENWIVKQILHNIRSKFRPSNSKDDTEFVLIC